MDGKELMDIGFSMKLLNLVPWGVYVLVLLVAVLTVITLYDRIMLRRIDLWDQLKQRNWPVAVVLSVLFASIFFFASNAGAATDEYDKHFRRAWHMQFSTIGDWQWLKAQGMQESRLDPYVCSPATACGLMQFLEGAAEDWGVDRFNPVSSIYGASRYMHWLWRNWSSPRPLRDRLYLSQASYNWGLGSLLNVQARLAKRGRPHTLWRHLEPRLPRETKEYPVRITAWCARFKGGTPCSI